MLRASSSTSSGLPPDSRAIESAVSSTAAARRQERPREGARVVGPEMAETHVADVDPQAAIDDGAR